MTNPDILHVSCTCGGVQWTAPYSENNAPCSCQMCDTSDARWVSCDPTDFNITAMTTGITGHQAGPYSQRHYHCTSCNDALWTWTPDWRRTESGQRENDYENPILNWNITLVFPGVSEDGDTSVSAQAA